MGWFNVLAGIAGLLSKDHVARHAGTHWLWHGLRHLFKHRR